MSMYGEFGARSPAFDLANELCQVNERSYAVVYDHSDRRYHVTDAQGAQRGLGRTESISGYVHP